MYKLFLTLRYLTRKKIVLFPIVVVWLCVMMLIIVTSIMGGFVERVRDANRELFGDIIVSSGSSTQGFAHYDELRAALAKQFPDIHATTPAIESYALIYAPGMTKSLPGLLVGIDPEERGKVSRYNETLFLQHRAPMEAVDDLTPYLPGNALKLQEAAAARVDAAYKAESAAVEALDKIAPRSETRPASVFRERPNFYWLIGLPIVFAVVALLFLRARRRRDVWGYIWTFGIAAIGIAVVFLGTTWSLLFPRTFDLAIDAFKQSQIDVNRAVRTADYAAGLPAGDYPDREALRKALVPNAVSFKVPDFVVKSPDPAFAKPADGCIAGSQLMVKRDKRGNFLHNAFPTYPKVVITVFPPSKSGNISISAQNAVQRAFTVVDDSHTGVYDVDVLNMYAPFELVQQMSGMRPDPELVKLDPSANFDPTCHNILIKLKPGHENELKQYADQMATFVEEFEKKYPGMPELTVQTWDEKQAKYLGAVENEKVMMTFILLLMSGVVVVVIFLIFYQIVRDKTRDIGIIKAVGGSEEGVAGIFLTYGLLVGLVGGGLGLLTGWAFVTHTNEIHEWIYHISGIVIWDRSVYLFDRIPDKVYTRDLVTYFCIALGAGILGAFIPAFVAAAEDPVKAIRYE